MNQSATESGRREPSATSSAVWLYGLEETNEVSDQLCLKHQLALANTMFKQHPRQLYTSTSPDGNKRNQTGYISIAERLKTSLTNCCMYPGTDCDTDHQLLVAMLKVRLAKRQRQNSIPPLNLEELKEEKAVQFAAEMTQNEVTPEDLWKRSKTVLREVAGEMIRSVKSQKKKKWISDETYAAIREKREAKSKGKNRYQEMKAEVQRKLRVDKQQQLEGMCVESEAANSKGNSRPVAASSDGGPTGGTGALTVLEFLAINFSVCLVY